MANAMGGHNMNMDDIFENFGDIFGEMFGSFGGQRKGRSKKANTPEPTRGHDLVKNIEITLKECLFRLQTKKSVITTLKPVKLVKVKVLKLVPISNLPNMQRAWRAAF